MVAFHFLLLVVPTTLMGLSLPLLARGVVASAHQIAPLVGRLYAVNTLGAAAGAALAGWWLMGEYGFVATVRVAASLNLGAAALVFLLWWRWRGHQTARRPHRARQRPPHLPPIRSLPGRGSSSMA
jgi:predicted membrane-bound spermidine synthase